MEFSMNPMSEKEIAISLGEPSADLQVEVNNAIAKAMQTLEEHFDQTFERPVVTYDLKGHTAGYAVISENLIRLNTELLYTHHDDMIERTVPHEVAHIVQYQKYPGSKSHGGEWQYIMAILGLPADRTHSYKTTAARVRKREFIYYCTDNCPGNPHMVTKTLHNRILKGQIYTCRQCKAQLREGG